MVERGGRREARGGIDINEGSAAQHSSTSHASCRTTPTPAAPMLARRYLTRGTAQAQPPAGPLPSGRPS